MSAMTPPSMPMLGSTDLDTFMGVRQAKISDALDCDIAIFGAPCATPYGGAPEYGAANLAAPQALREGIKMWASANDRFDWDLGERPLVGRDDRVVDLGDLATHPATPAENRGLIKSTVDRIIAAGAVPFALGGDDSIPIPMLGSLKAKEEVHVLQIDAHIDWRDHVGGERYGLSSVMRRASEMSWVKGIVQVGARGLSSAGFEEIDIARKWGADLFPAQHIFDHGIDDVVRAVPKGANVHVNLDLDALDPSIMPAVFVPAPGGLLYWHVAKLLMAVAEKASICSFALVEFAPSRDINGTAALTAARIASLAMGSILKSRYVGK
ncbi:arginase family protein [Aminobacter ciceronei]|uniref:Agmatinase n=1 Tax=Aminobacter ciceronei TaxID=150723 RepID=A0ABR6CHD0_9HYPH|nr:arginase family protein [Aminobacter ciceronei]MBA8910553.1 agmatinase [Aminobacter ciceronei]MBA9024324.1 agmatinase [Aminobacter ciceronei]